MSAYIKQLQNSMPSTPSRSTLREQFLAWYGGLPIVARNRPFSMTEFERALGTQGKYISPVLLTLGWQRKRRWSSQGQYHRYWVPSDDATDSTSIGETKKRDKIKPATR